MMMIIIIITVTTIMSWCNFCGVLLQERYIAWEVQENIEYRNS